MTNIATGLSRREMLGGTVLSAAVLLTGTAARAATPGTVQVGDIQVKAVEFNNNGIKMAGNIFYPKSFKTGAKYATIVVSHPNGGVKEQTAGVYAQRLAEQGFLTLAFDASHQGASGGQPRLLDDPMKRVGDIYSAVDYLTSLPEVDAQRIGALGICAGSGATIKASSMERRIKAVATVSAVDVGEAARRSWDGKGKESDQLATLDAIAKQRTVEAAGGERVYVPYVPQVGDKTAPRDLQEAADYYLTPRGQHPNAPNKMLLTGLSSFFSFTAFAQADTFLTQPLMIVAGSEAGSLWHSEVLHAKAAGPKELFIVEGATHMDLYDGEGVGLAMNKLSPFFTQNL